jgi:glycosyltransferase involved in cell wall biosynthesis
MKIRKVCFFLPSANRDGAELSGLECMDALRSLGIDCHVVVPKDGPLLEEFPARQISHQVIPYKVWIEPPVPVWKRLLVTLWNLVITYFAVFLIGRRKGDLIITNTINICVGALVAKLWGLPHVWYIREFGLEDHGWRFHLGEKPALWIMNRLALQCLAVSRAVAQKYQKSIKPSKVHYLYQPIDVDPSSYPDTALDKTQFPVTCIIVGKLQEGKRQEDAIRAIGALRDQGISAQLWVVGSGDRLYADYLETLVRENNLAERVTFFGQVKNAFPYMQQADVLLLCSRCEAFARVVVEAMKAGKPVIGTKSGGTVEQIKDGFNGFLYKPRDHQELAAKMKYFCDHPEAAQEMGKNGQQWAMRTFTRERYQQDLSRILGQL